MADRPKLGGTIMETAIQDGQDALSFMRHDLELLSRKLKGNPDAIETINQVLFNLVDVQAALSVLQRIGGEAKRERTKESQDATDA